MTPDSQRLRYILILDDEGPIRHSLKAFFTDIGYQAVDCASPSSALEVLSSQQVDVAVVDLEMPEMNGAAFIRQARPIQPHTRYVVYTGSLNQDLLAQLDDMGIPHSMVLQKPLTSIAEMLETVQKAFYGE